MRSVKPRFRSAGDARPMNATFRPLVPIAGALFGLVGAPAQASVSMQGAVSLDYYVANVDNEGSEHAQSQIQVDSIVNPDASASGPLSLSGWLTPDASPAGPGTEAGNASIGVLSANSSLQQVDRTVS